MTTAMLALTLGSFGLECCPFCSLQGGGKRLVDKVQEAQYVACGRLSNSRLNANPLPDEPLGTTDMKVLKVVKNHAKAPKAESAKLQAYMPAAEKEAGDYLVFADVRDGALVPFSAMPLQQNFLEYLESTMKLENAPSVQRLKHFFAHLDNPDEEISRDAYMEFAAAPFKDVAGAAKSFDADKVLKWLRDKNTASYKLGLYGLMIGVAGRSQDAATLKAILDDPEQRPLTGCDGLIAGYCLLEPKKGVEFVGALLCDEKQDFNFRYPALRAARFLIEEGKADKPWLMGKLATQAADNSFGDLVIDDLRKAKYWDCAAAVFAVENDAKTRSNSMLRRAALRYALRCPGPAAQKFIAAVKAKPAEPNGASGADRVANEVDALAYEDNVVATPAEAKKKN